MQPVPLENVPPPEPPRVTQEAVGEEIAALRSALSTAHNVRLRFVISTQANPLGPLKGGPLSYTLDSADPEELKGIVDDMQHRARQPIAELLPSTLVIGRNYATERLKTLFEKFGIDPTPNFIALDETRARLYALALANKDLAPWLAEYARDDAPRLAAFMQAQLHDFRDKFTLLLPDDWLSAGQWTRRRFAGIPLIVDPNPHPRHFRRATDPLQDRVFLVVQRKGEAHPAAAAITNLRNAGYPMAVLTFGANAPLAHYLQVVEDTAHALGLSAPDTIPDEPLDDPEAALGALKSETPESLAHALDYAAKFRAFTWGEIVFFGDLARIPLLRKNLDIGARWLFRSPFRMPAGVFEGPSEVLLDNPGCFTLLAISATQNRFALASCEPGRHISQFLATKLALERRRRLVRAILVKDLSIESIAGLEEFFSRTARNLSLGTRHTHGEIQSR